MSSGSIRIIQLPEKSSVNTDDYMAVDSSANGTKKVKFTDLLDNNLSAQNKAADAQATGEAINDISARVDNMINTQQNASVTTLWTGRINLKNETANLSESINNFDFIDVYCGGTDTVFARQHVSGSSVHFELQAQNMSDDASVQFMRWWETGLTISGTTVTINKAIQCYWDDFSQHPIVSQATGGGIDIVRIDGVKIGHVENDEIVDARVGVDGTSYPTLGDAIRGQVTDLKSDFPLICGESNELDQVSYVDAKGIGENGNIIDAPALHYTSSMPVISGETYTVKTSYDISGDSAVLRIHGYDSSDSWVQQIAFHTFSNPEVYSVDITIPTGISAIRVSGKKTINFDYVVRKDNLSQRIDAVNNEVVDYQNNISTYRVPTNLYNKDSALNRDGYLVNTGNNYGSDSGSSATHPIKMEVGKTYCFKAYTSYFGAATNKIVKFCDAEGNLVPNTYIEATAATGYFYFTWTSSRADVSDYVCVNVRKSEKSNMIFAEGNTLPEYSSYFDPFWQIKESALPSSLPLPLNAQLNVLYGKKIAVDGDSIMKGDSAGGGFAKMIADDNGMTLQTLAATGATLATGTTVDGGGNRHWVASSVSNLSADADYYIVEGGVNDFALSVPLGTMTSGYTDTLNTATVLGALEHICKTLQTTFMGKKYGFVFTHKCYANTSTYITTWVPAMKQVLEKWGIPYIDLGELAPQLNNLDALRPYTLNGDGWHPTENGYKLFYVPKITAWMKTL